MTVLLPAVSCTALALCLLAVGYGLPVVVTLVAGWIVRKAKCPVSRTVAFLRHAAVQTIARQRCHLFRVLETRWESLQRHWRKEMTA